jgi:hypothetical protein
MIADRQVNFYTSICSPLKPTYVLTNLARTQG